MPKDPDLFMEIREMLVKSSTQIETILERLNKQNDSIEKLWKANNENSRAIARTQQWITDHERKEAFLLSLATIILSAMIWIANWVLK